MNEIALTQWKEGKKKNQLNKYIRASLESKSHREIRENKEKN